MAAKLLKKMVKRFRFRSRKRRTSGYTILELLVATLIATFVVIALTDFVVDLLQTDRREYARSETQREMQMALDFMVNDIREAAYVYNNEELNNQRGVAARLKEYIPDFGSGVEPILVFWKPEQFPYQQSQRLPDCGAAPNPVTPAWTECNLLQVKRRTYTLVAYLHTRNPANDPKWKGISRIMRYELRMYQPGTGSTAVLTKTSGYVEPSPNVSFKNWPFDLNNNNIQSQNGGRPAAGSPPVLVDFVDFPNQNRSDGLAPPTDTECPNTTYQRIPPVGTSGFDNPSFMVCVSSAVPGGSSNNNNQDVVIFLRGNPTGKAGVKIAPLIAVRTQAVARGVIDKKPQ